MEEAAGAEGGSGAARVDGDGGAPAVGDRNGGVDEVGEDAAKPKEAAPRWEAVRGDDGGGPELGGDGGERESDVASLNPARRKGGERRNRTEEAFRKYKKSSKPYLTFNFAHFNCWRLSHGFLLF
uniref:Transposon protein, putative, unclassified n=2 Tax=Oryza sativa subsp. japonica TaxID=39947 RepID=Q53N39_ORYSJ|nr:transposon protein, putative, CACTA, En/Spm sub-class [Oryza sativa Japonica Group]ABA92564.1 transposon protein, putative, unclassified [Oryza sativa Japonica Group]